MDMLVVGVNLWRGPHVKVYGVFGLGVVESFGDQLAPVPFGLEQGRCFQVLRLLPEALVFGESLNDNHVHVMDEVFIHLVPLLEEFTQRV